MYIPAYDTASLPCPAHKIRCFPIMNMGKELKSVCGLCILAVMNSVWVYNTP